MIGEYIYLCNQPTVVIGLKSNPLPPRHSVSEEPLAYHKEQDKTAESQSDTAVESNDV